MDYQSTLFADTEKLMDSTKGSLFDANWRAKRTMDVHSTKVSDSAKRHSFIGGSDARIIMGNDEAALLRLWREKRGEAKPPDYSANLVVQLGLATEELNRRWYERSTGEVIKDIQS